MIRRPLPLLLATVLAAGGATAMARDPANSRLPDSVRRVERETGGQVLRADPMRQGDRDVPRLKVLTPDGRVRILRADEPRPGAQGMPPPRPDSRRDEIPRPPGHKRDDN